MRLVGYVRVSTLGQAKDGLGLPTQERLVRRWCRDNGHRLVRLVSDNGRSGAVDETGRPGLLDALSAVRDHSAEGVVVSSLDRLARSITVQEAVLGRVWAEGGAVFTVDRGEVALDDPDDPMRTAMRQMAGVFHELDRRIIVKRLRDGRVTAAAQGRHAVGDYAYGERDADEAAMVELVHVLHAEGQSLRAIIATLDAEGYRPRRGQRFHPSTISRILART